VSSASSSGVDETALLDEALARIARLEAALAITGGTLHDINNLLTVLSGNLYLLTEAVRDDPALLEKARSARNSASKSVSLMRELLTFSRGTESGDQIICPVNHVKALEPFLRRGLRTGHELEIHGDPRPWSAAASAAQFESAITNLVFNARDAMPERGKIVIRTVNAALSGEECRKQGLQAGDYVQVCVMDTGHGIPADVLPRVIEPLFTTKKRGEGTGLGLNMVHRFAHRAGGAMHISSVEGEGTSVHIWLPRSDHQAEVTANMTLPLTALQGGDETVFLVSSDLEVRTAIQDILQALGYAVVLAAKGKALPGNLPTGDASSILVCERSDRTMRADHRWIQSLRGTHKSLKHVALLRAEDDPGEAAPDADAVLYRPITVVDLAKTMRAAVEGKHR